MQLTILTVNAMITNEHSRVTVVCKSQSPLLQFPRIKSVKVGDFPVASPQQLSNFPIASFPKIHYTSFLVASP